MNGGHPPAPWRLAGPAVVVPALVPLERARAVVPRDVGVVPVARDRTLGAIIAVTYEAGSTLTYSELVVMAALVRARRRVGGWVSHIWVDSDASVSGGRSIWKLPKEPAEFDTERPGGGGGQRFAARAGGASLVRIAAAAPSIVAPAAPSLVPMVSGGEGSLWFTLGRSVLRGGPARVRVDVPAESPVASLGLIPAPLGFAGRARLVMDAARPV